MLCGWTTARWQHLNDELAEFDELERRRIFHLAFENRYRTQILDAISEHARGPLKQPLNAKLQVITCIDDREESFRRHLEEIDPQVETFGAAGFFSVPMFFRGAADAHFIPLCPVIVTPKISLKKSDHYLRRRLKPGEPKRGDCSVKRRIRST